MASERKGRAVVLLVNATKIVLAPTGAWRTRTARAELEHSLHESGIREVWTRRLDSDESIGDAVREALGWLSGGPLPTGGDRLLVGDWPRLPKAERNEL